MAYHIADEDEQQRAITTAKRPYNEATTFQTFVQNKKETGGDHKQQYKKIVQKD